MRQMRRTIAGRDGPRGPLDLKRTGVNLEEYFVDERLKANIHFRWIGSCARRPRAPLMGGRHAHRREGLKARMEPPSEFCGGSTGFALR